MKTKRSLLLLGFLVAMLAIAIPIGTQATPIEENYYHQSPAIEVVDVVINNIIDIDAEFRRCSIDQKTYFTITKSQGTLIRQATIDEGLSRKYKRDVNHWLKKAHKQATKRVQKTYRKHYRTLNR